MLPSEKLAIAAHLHVLLRRKSGRVTDTEWMAGNVEYATEIVQFARARAREDGHADLAEWADKLEMAMAATAPRTAPVTAPAGAALESPASPGLDSADLGLSRYIRGLR